MRITYRIKLMPDGGYSLAHWNPYRKCFIHLYKLADYKSAELLSELIPYKYRGITRNE